MAEDNIGLISIINIRNINAGADTATETGGSVNLYYFCAYLILRVLLFARAGE